MDTFSSFVFQTFFSVVFEAFGRTAPNRVSCSANAYNCKPTHSKQRVGVGGAVLGAQKRPPLRTLLQKNFTRLYPEKFQDNSKKKRSPQVRKVHALYHLPLAYLFGLQEKYSIPFHKKRLFSLRYLRGGGVSCHARVRNCFFFSPNMTIARIRIAQQWRSADQIKT